MYPHAQNFEDVMLSRLFYGKTDGFYIDVGAYDPDFLSVTKSFYDIGWNGINIEPLKNKWELFQEKRPRDININAAVGTSGGKAIIINVVGSSALSSTDLNRQEQLEASFESIERLEVDLITLDSVFENHVSRDVDFLKIDVEGSEADVLLSLNLLIYRPKVFVIEAVKPVQKFPGWMDYDPSFYESWHDWQNFVLSHGYIDAYFDGLNKFYIRDDQAHLISRLKLPPGVFDFIIPSILDSFIEEAKAKESVIQIQNQELQDKENTIQQKEIVINGLVLAIQAYRLAYWPLWPFVHLSRIMARTKRRCTEILRPRLGNLNQYSPRPLVTASLCHGAKQLTTTPKFSIVTPSFQQGGYIERTIRSVLDQGYPNLEYFVQDGGSKDSTVAVLKKYEAKLSGWISEKDTGQSQAINCGFANTSGEIMAWLNSDDMLLPGTLHTVADFFNRHPEVDVVYGNRLLIDENDMEIGRWIMPWHDSAVLSWADYVPQETLFWRRRIWANVGGQIDESFRFAMDWDLLVRFRDAGAKFAHIPQFLGAFRIHEHQKTSAAISEIGHQEMDRIRGRLLGRVPSRREIRQGILPYLLRHVAVDMAYRIKTRLGCK